MNLIEQIIAFVFTRLFSAGLGKVSSQYPCQEFLIVEKKGDLDSLINTVKSFGESNKWKLAEIKTREGARIITWVEGGFGTSWPRTVGFEVRETPDKFYIWAESRYNKNQIIDRGESKKNIELLKTFFSQNYEVVPTDLTWEEATKQVPLK